MPDRDRKTKRKSKVVKKTLNPSFEDQFKFKLSPEEMNASVLNIHLCRDGMLKDDVIGKLAIGFRSLYGDFEWNDWFILTKKAKMGRRPKTEDGDAGAAADDQSDARSVSGLSISGQSAFSFATAKTGEASRALADRGQLRLALRYESKNETLHVMVKDARDLPSREKGRTATYVKLYLLPDPKKKTKKKKKLSERASTPAWEETFAFKVPAAEYASRS